VSKLKRKGHRADTIVLIPASGTAKTYRVAGSKSHNGKIKDVIFKG